jgi:hypothetical protein
MCCDFRDEVVLSDVSINLCIVLAMRQVHLNRCAYILASAKAVACLLSRVRSIELAICCNFRYWVAL